MNGPFLTFDDLIRGLDAFPAYQAIDVFASSVQELRSGRPVAGLVKISDTNFQLFRGDRVFLLDWFPDRNVLRLRRSIDITAPAGVGAGAGAVIGGALSAAIGKESAAGVLAGALLGLLVGAAVGSAAAGAAATRVFTLTFDPMSRQWLAYDGGLVPWMKNQLLVPGATH